MDEIEKLNMRNQQLMTVLSVKEATATSTEENKAKPSSSYERLNVGVSHVSESSSSEEQIKWWTCKGRLEKKVLKLMY